MSRLLLLLVKISVASAILGGVVVAGLFIYELEHGPRMRTLVHLTPWEAAMPALPREVVPLYPRAAPGEENFSASLPAVRANLLRGKTYYQYYCLFCHGEDGCGSGPVGGSYMPRPADLRQAKFRDYSDERLIKAMLTGIGHEPVLARVVPPEHRRWLLPFLRSMAAGNTSREGRDDAGR